jgi:hypothetical protein
MDKIDLAQDREQWQAFENTGGNVWLVSDFPNGFVITVTSFE